MMAAAVGCGLLPLGCVKEDVAPLGEQHNVAVQLNVGTRAVSEADGTMTRRQSIRSASMPSSVENRQGTTLRTT